MASYAIHLAIAKKYLESHPKENEEEFIDGTVDVDWLEDKVKSHYTGDTDKSNLKRFLTQKVLLPEYVKQNSINTSYDRGYFLHLLTDYYFYNGFFDEKWIDATEYKEFKEVLYHDYPILNSYIDKKYDLTYPEKIKQFSGYYTEGEPIILSKNSIDRFIASMAELDIDNIYNSIQSPVVKVDGEER